MPALRLQTSREASDQREPGGRGRCLVPGNQPVRRCGREFVILVSHILTWGQWPRLSSFFLINRLLTRQDPSPVRVGWHLENWSSTSRASQSWRLGRLERLAVSTRPWVGRRTSLIRMRTTKPNTRVRTGFLRRRTHLPYRDVNVLDTLSPSTNSSLPNLRNRCRYIPCAGKYEEKIVSVGSAG